MFVRWKNRTLARKHGSDPAERSLYAVIVKNQRVEGRTKQKVVKYLAHISEQHLADQQHQANFWHRTDQALAELELTAELRAEIEEKIASVVPRPAFTAGLAMNYDASSTPAARSKRRVKSLERSMIAAAVIEP
jgi:hypothetical protein